MEPSRSRVLDWLTASPARLLCAVLVVLLLGSVAVVASSPRATVSQASDSEEPTPVVFDPSTAELTGRDAYSETLTDANGVSQMAISLEPVHIERDGEWLPASAELKPSHDGGWEAADHALGVRIPESTGDEQSVVTSYQGHEVSFTLLGTDVKPGEVVESSETESEVVFDDAVNGADLQYILTPSSLKESVVLHAAPENDQVYTWTMSTGALTAERTDEGMVVLRDEVGEVVMHVPTPIMWDSSGIEGIKEDEMALVDFALELVAEGEYELTFTPDMEWLSAGERVYPVYVDPTFVAGQSTRTAYKYDGYVLGGYSRVGNPSSGSFNPWRTVVHYPYSGMGTTRRVTDTLGEATRTSGGTANCYLGYGYQATSWSFGGRGSLIATFAFCSPYGHVDGQGLTDSYSLWINAQAWSGTLHLSGGECYCWSYKQFNSTMYIYYVSKHTINSVDGPANGENHVVAPTVSATGSVYSGGTQLFRYVFTSTNGGTDFTSPYVVAGPYKVPDGVLTPGKHYDWKVESVDNLPASPVVTSDTRSFTMEAAPGAPTNVTVDGQPLTADVTSSTARPFVSAVVSDPVGGDVQALFTVRQDGIVIMDSVPGTWVDLDGAGPYVSEVQLPYALSAGSDYTIEVVAFDGHMRSETSTTPEWEFYGPPRDVREFPGTNDTDTGVAE